MKNDIRKQINRIGAGWFILRLSNDFLGSSYDLHIGYSPDAINTRESGYKKLLPNAKTIIKVLKRDDSTMLAVNTLGLNSSDIKIVLDDLAIKLSKVKPSSLKLKTKACRGIHFSDTANSAIRAILSSLGSITDEELYDTEEFFDWKCPYTGRDLKADILGYGDRKNVEVDHIVPQNSDECGLNVFGNLVYVDKSVNLAKKGINAEDYINSLPSLSSLEKKQRIQKIHDLQSLAKYNPTKIKTKIGPKLKKIYNKIIEDLEKYSKECK